MQKTTSKKHVTRGDTPLGACQSANEAHAHASVRVLVVDDNDGGRYALSRCLRNAGYHTLEASTAAECMRIMEKEPCAVILLDVNLPDLNGTELCRRLKADPRMASVPVIQVSAMFTATEDRIAGLESGADAYLTAPFDTRELLAHVSALARAHRAEDALRESEERLRSTFEQVGVGLAHASLDGMLLRVNKRFGAILGYAPHELLKISWAQLVYPEDLPGALADSQRLLNGEVPDYSMERRYIRKDGSIAWLNVTVSLVRDRSGAPSYLLAAANDVTDRKLAEGRLRESEERFRAMADGLPLIVWLHGPDGEQRFVNKTFCEFFGVERELMQGGGWELLMHPDDAPGYRQAFFTSLKERRQFHAEVRVRNATGQWRWIESWARPRYAPSGEFLGIIGTSADVTERRAAEADLRQTTQRFALLSETAASLLRAGDPQVVVEDLCRKVMAHLDCDLFFNFLKEPGTDKLRLNACSGIPEEERRKVEWLEYGMAVCGCVARDGACIVAEEIQTKDDPRTTLVRSYGVKAYCCHPLTSEDELIGTLSFGSRARQRFSSDDVSLMRVVADQVAIAMVRLRTERALRESVDKYERQVRLFEGVASTTPDFVYIFDPQGKFLYANRRLLEVWGMRLPEVIGKTCRELGYEQWHHDMHMKEIAQVISTRKPIKGEVPFKAARTGIFGVYEYIFTPVLGAGGAVELIAGTTRDITEHKEFEATLERLVTERTAKLHDMVAELEHFSYSITHDMRAPLRAMRGFAEVLREESDGSKNPEVAMCVRRIITSAKRMDLLITDALNYSKAVRQELPLVPVDLERLLDGMLETYPEFLAHRACIQVERPLHTVLGNEAALIQCFSNLIGNALKFCDAEREPSVRIRSEPFVPDISSAEGDGNGGHTPAAARRNWVRLTVEDNGIGVPAMMMPRMFQMFARGSRDYEGTGIGLALVRKVVQRMGGKVGVESEHGKGSCFWIELPSASAE
jgi:PAS domain S-box-containing protein